jgi:hypothetical protein
MRATSLSLVGEHDEALAGYAELIELTEDDPKTHFRILFNAAKVVARAGDVGKAQEMLTLVADSEVEHGVSEKDIADAMSWLSTGEDPRDAD